MNKQKITPLEKDFSKWYLDIVREADLAETSEVRGCGIVKPYGLKIWELIKHQLNKYIEDDGVENIYFPLFIPMENIQAEKDHVKGFAPELAVVTHGGGEELVNKLAVRPTSETAMYKSYSKWINSYKDLPLRLNQWNNVVRWEKRPRPFLRWSEFLWQEGHSAFATKKEALDEVWRMLDYYEKTYNFMSVPVFKGIKSEGEKFAGGEATATCEAMAKDGRSIQASTSHYLGTHFAKVFNIKYTNNNGEKRLVHQTSWGFAWRAVGILIMTHSDNDGLVLPPNVAPIQVVIVPVYNDNNKTEVLNYSSKVYKLIKNKFRAEIDLVNNETTGFKFNKWEVRGVPFRIEIGGREATGKNVTLFRRDTKLKTKIELNLLLKHLLQQSKTMGLEMLDRAREFSKTHIKKIESLKDLEENKNFKGFFEASWSENLESEKILKERYGITPRVLLKTNINKKPTNTVCFITGKKAKHNWYFAKSY